MVFGILNVTPDSFSDGGEHLAPERAISAGLAMIAQGADGLDIGGESTRPGSESVSPDEQLRRIMPVLEGLMGQLPQSDRQMISIDTRSARVARETLQAGGDIINDISALRDDPAMAKVIAEHQAGVILMHMQGSPATMQQNPRYDDVVGEICEFLHERMVFARSAGIRKDRIMADPGIGFGKTTEHNLEILAHLERFACLEVPIMVGPSRKRFIGEILGQPEPRDRLLGTAGAVAACVLAGIECLRVHDVAACRQIADLCKAIRAKKTE